MMKSTLQTMILSMLEKKASISLRDITKVAHLSPTSPTNRRMIQRALSHLIQENILEAFGHARARAYRLSKQIGNPQHVFHNIALSAQSTQLLQFVLQPIQKRKSIGYQSHFLKSYVPNKTNYLNTVLRKELWMLGTVGEVFHSAGTYARTILNRLLIDLSWNSSRLEGNTYSLLETKRLIDLGEFASGKTVAEAQMILNHKNAIEYLMDTTQEKKISLHDIRSIHALLSENLLGDPSACGGIRKIGVGIAGSAYHPLDNPHLLQDYMEVFIDKLNRIHDPFEQSFFSLVHLSYLQAFEDVNKRTSRLVSNIPFIKNNLRPLSFTDVSQQDYTLCLLGIYEKNDINLLRDLYHFAYRQSSQRYSAIQQSIGEPNLFKLKHREVIHDIVRKIIIENVHATRIVSTVRHLIDLLHLPSADATQLFEIIETEILCLHAGNIARYKILPSEYQRWKINQQPEKT